MLTARHAQPPLLDLGDSCSLKLCAFALKLFALSALLQCVIAQLFQLRHLFTAFAVIGRKGVVARAVCPPVSHHSSLEVNAFTFLVFLAQSLVVQLLANAAIKLALQFDARLPAAPAAQSLSGLARAAFRPIKATVCLDFRLESASRQ